MELQYYFTEFNMLSQHKFKRRDAIVPTFPAPTKCEDNGNPGQSIPSPAKTPELCFNPQAGLNALSVHENHKL